MVKFLALFGILGLDAKRPAPVGAGRKNSPQRLGSGSFWTRLGSQIGLTSAKAGVFPLFTGSFGGSKVFFSSIFSPNICITRAETILKALWYEISTFLPFIVEFENKRDISSFLSSILVWEIWTTNLNERW